MIKVDSMNACLLPRDTNVMLILPLLLFSEIFLIKAHARLSVNSIEGKPGTIYNNLTNLTTNTSGLDVSKYYEQSLRSHSVSLSVFNYPIAI
jgi:hypothetical protein